MLHYETLSLLHFFAQRTRGAILEIGPFTGAATAVMAAAAPPEVPVVTVEMGGAYNHPQLPSTDIISDLRKTLAQHNLSDRVTVIEGASHDPGVAAQILRALKGRPIDLLVIDADGNVSGDMDRLAPYLAHECVIVLDDYTAAEAPEKMELVKAWVDEAIASGIVRDLGVYKWGTWFGQYAGNKRSLAARTMDALSGVFR
jgi:predicted O-methyltransferase YrrM